MGVPACKIMSYDESLYLYIYMCIDIYIYSFKLKHIDVKIYDIYIYIGLQFLSAIDCRSGGTMTVCA